MIVVTARVCCNSNARSLLPVILGFSQHHGPPTLVIHNAEIVKQEALQQPSC